MKKVRFKKIDAFARGLSSGNPAGCVYLDEVSLTEAEMLQIARELKGYVNEVVFAKTNEDNEIPYSLSYYSSECRVDFCGHGTIACMYDLISNDKNLINLTHIAIDVAGTKLMVLNEIGKEDAIYIAAPQPRFIHTELSSSAVARALDIATEEINLNTPIALVNSGLDTLLVPINNLKTCLNISPDINSLKVFCEDNHIEIILIYSQEVSYRNHGYRTRVFAPRFGYLEDPATGSGNSAFANHLLRSGRWDGANLIIEQGTSSDNPNIIKLRTCSSGCDFPQVLFGGGALVRIEGVYCLN
ncbi:MAG: PhzF family phenazine biosynthesis protein [Chitinophagales bacterium]